MKKLFLVVFIGLFLCSCLPAIMQILTKEDRVFVYSHKVELSQKMLNEKLIDYINIKSHQFAVEGIVRLSPEVIEISNNYISFRKNIKVYHYVTGKPYLMYFIGTFEIDDGGYKFIIEIMKFTKMSLELDYVHPQTSIYSPIKKGSIKYIFDTLDADIYEYMYGTVGW